MKFRWTRLQSVTCDTDHACESGRRCVSNIKARVASNLSFKDAWATAAAMLRLTLNPKPKWPDDPGHESFAIRWEPRRCCTRCVGP